MIGKEGTPVDGKDNGGEGYWRGDSLWKECFDSLYEDCLVSL